jgi:hypothetical protein
MEVPTDQAAALARIAELVEAPLWSPRQRREWTAMLTAMVHATDWDTGPVVGVSRPRPPPRAAQSARTHCHVDAREGDERLAWCPVVVGLACRVDLV